MHRLYSNKPFSARRLFWVWLILLFGYSLSATAQSDTSRRETPVRSPMKDISIEKVDTLSPKPIKAGPTDSLTAVRLTATTDSITHRDSIFYTRLKTRMYKHNITRQIYDAIFQDVYNSRLKTGEVNTIEVNPFQAFEGKIIGAIYIRRLSVFGQTVYDTLRKPNNWAERLGGKIHTNTREHVIRNSYLLFHEGDAINPIVLRDNERLLRSTSIFHDARILVVPRANSRQFVDVYVITQDVWSLLPNGGFGGFTSFALGFDQLNFRGLGHQLSTQVAYSGTDPRQKLEYQAHYKVPFIGKTFLTAQADFLYLRDLKQVSAKLYRPFITPDTKYAGSIEINHTQINNRLVTREDSVLLVPLSYNYTDIWIGRSFRLFYKQQDAERKGRPRIIVAVRRTSYDYFKRPDVTADTNQIYQDSRTTLFGAGYSRRKYARDVLIYGFGRTEDVPVGTSVFGIYGFDNAELGRRLYTGLNFSHGGYIRQLGYLYSLVSMGGYIRSHRVEQGVFSLEANYFSPLVTSRWGNMRHFFNTRYTTGVGRFDNEYISLGNTGSGLEADGFNLNTDALRGTKRLFLNYETILFSKINLIGFRIAFITTVNLGLASFSEQSLLRSTLYQGYGIGFRLRNENLTFNSIQIRLSYYPNIPNNTIPFRQSFEAVPTLRFRDFDLSAPQIIPYR